MTERTCIVDGCNGKHRARGWCNMHYQRVTDHGSPAKPQQKTRPIDLPTKVCSSCHAEKPTTDFYVDTVRRTVSQQCKPCFNSQARGRLYRAKYGVSVEDFDRMMTSQHGVCAICKEKCSTGKRLSVDHNHTTGAVRGLLCRKCNSAIGYFNDDPALLIKAVGYLAERT